MSVYLAGTVRGEYGTRMPRSVGSDRLFLVLLIALLIVSANVGLINQLIATKDDVGRNIIGLRDIVFVCAIGVGLSHMRTRLLAHLGIAGTAVMVVLLLIPVSALVGIMKNAEIRDVVVEVGTMLSWALAVIIPTALRNPRSLRVLHQAFVLTGLTIALGVLFETQTQMRFPVVTATFVAQNLKNHIVRSTASGWPTMILCVSLLATSVMFDNAGYRNRRNMGRCLGLFLCALAALLSQSRTLVVGVGAGLASSIIMAIIAGRRLRSGGALLLAGTAAAGLFCALVAGEQFLREGFGEYFTARYSVLVGDNLDEYAVTDVRRFELDRAWSEGMQSPVYGLGIGVPYREVFYSAEASGLLAHNLVTYFITRFGFPGLLTLLVFSGGMIRCQYRACRDTSPRCLMWLGFASGVVSLLACAWFGNVFASPYSAQQAMLAVGVVLAHERLRQVPELARDLGTQLTGPWSGRVVARVGAVPRDVPSRPGGSVGTWLTPDRHPVRPSLTRMFHRRSDFVVLGIPVRFGGRCGGVRAGSGPGCGDRGGLVASDSPSKNAIRTQFD